MQLHQLRALVCIAETGSISSAARALQLSQPAVTRALKQLELAVKATLLLRSASGVVLTSYGEALLPYARRIMREADHAQDHLSQLAGEKSGALALASSAVPFMLVVPRALELVRQQFPRAHVRLQEAVYPTVMNLFRDAAIDFAIGPVPADGLGADFKCDPLFEVELVVAVKRGHRLSRAKSLAALTEMNWIITGPIGGPGAVHESAFAGAGLTPSVCVMQCESTGAAFQIIEHSNVASFVPRPMAELAQTAGLITIVEIKEFVPPLQISMFMPAQTILTPASQALYSAIRSVSRSLPLARRSKRT